jgi:hypothetical protein
MRRKKLAARFVARTALLAFLPAASTHLARADTAGTPTDVSAFGCIVTNGGHATFSSSQPT